MDGVLQPALGLGTALAPVSVAAHVVAAVSRSGQLSLNHSIGIRTRHTVASDEAWQAGHAAAAPTMARAAWTGYAFLVVMAATALALGLANAAPWLLGLAVAGLVTVVVILSAARRSADRAARDTPSHG